MLSHVSLHPLNAELAGVEGIPKVHIWASSEPRPVLITSPLGNPLLNIRDSRQALDLCVATLRVLEAVHRRGWIHGDISPDNIVVTKRGNPVVIDWGCALKAGTVTFFRGKRRYASARLLEALRCGKSVTIDESDDYESLWHTASALLHRPRTPFVGVCTARSLEAHLRALAVECCIAPDDVGCIFR